MPVLSDQMESLFSYVRCERQKSSIWNPECSASEHDCHNDEKCGQVQSVGPCYHSRSIEGMWIGSSRDKTSKPFGLKWPDEQIKALGVITHSISNSCKKKKFIERLDSVKKTYKHLIYKRSFYLWKSNNYQVFNHTKICLHFLTHAGAHGNH